MKVSAGQTRKAIEGGWNFCEGAPVMRDLGIDYSPCLGPLENAHSVKSVHRGKDPVLDTETARICRWHHQGVLDLKSHAVQARVVREAIKRRGNA